MDPLEQAAKNGKLTQFKELWYKSKSIDPLKDKTDYSAQILNDYNFYRSNSSPKSPEAKGNIVSTIVGLASGAAETQVQKGYMPSSSEELIEFKDVMSVIVDQQGNLNDLNVIGQKIIESAASQVGLYLQQQTELLGVTNKQMGMSGDYAKAYRQTLTTANQELLKYGITFGELTQAATNLINTTGRFARLNAETWKQAGVVGSAFVGTLQEMAALYPEFEKIGLGAADTNKAIAKAGQDALNVGLQSQKVVGMMKTDLGKLNEYGFKNGVQGLAEMSRKAVEFRMSMTEAFKVAEKVMSPEGAIELSANLQVLGGAIGDFNDPLKLMYMATNNVEGLQDALIGAAQNLTTYNKEQGRFEITGINLRRAKEMAAQLGVSYEELSKGAIAAAERSSAAADLMSRGFSMSKEQQEFITNISSMKDGKMVIALDSKELQSAFGKTEIALDELTQEQAADLMKYQDQFKKLTPEDIVRGQATNIENITRSVNYIAAVLREQGGKGAKEIADKIGINFDEYSKKANAFAEREGPELKKWGEEMNKSIREWGTNAEKDKEKGKVGGVESKKGLDDKMREENKPQSQQQNQQQTTTKSSLDVNIKATEAVVDEFSRWLVKNPQYLDMMNGPSQREYNSAPVSSQ